MGRIEFLGLEFDPLDEAGAAGWLAARGAGDAFAYVVTPNVDHVVRLNRRAATDPVRAAYRDADLCLCDSRVLARLARACGVRLSVAPGSDLTVRLLDGIAVADDLIAVVGGDAELLDGLRRLRPDLIFVQHVPPMGMAKDEAAMAAAAAFITLSHARFALLAVGSPQQELLAQRVKAQGGARGTALCIGASIEFVTGAKARAPRWMQRAGIEWLHRLLSEPRRLGRRYLIEGPAVFALAWKWRRGR